ncbi:unnamed protein product [Mycena citricolor]|uniref:Uncharacterized protein n=1 Tax=Mycena citricolor TaxID=2018698 RepID=A0AAD2K546_9AGAR|nr:unnamed protein product [Mycena citricolor]
MSQLVFSVLTPDAAAASYAGNAKRTPAPTTLRGPSIKSVVPFEKLIVSEAQKADLQSMYTPRSPTTTLEDKIFDSTVLADQAAAFELLERIKLNLDTQKSVHNRWAQVWSTAKSGKTRRILYQCTSGYDHTKLSKKAPGKEERRVPTRFTGCLAHVELTTRDDYILRIRGHFRHCEECLDAPIERLPPIPVHKSPQLPPPSPGCTPAGVLLGTLRRSSEGT